MESQYCLLGPLCLSGIPTREAASSNAAEIRAGRQGFLPKETSLSTLVLTCPQIYDWRSKFLDDDVLILSGTQWHNGFCQNTAFFGLRFPEIPNRERDAQIQYPEIQASSGKSIRQCVLVGEMSCTTAYYHNI